MTQQHGNSLYKPAYCVQAVKLCRLGATDRELADFFEVSEQTVNAWKIRYPKFLESLNRGKQESDNRVEQSLYRRALGYSHDAVKIFCDKDNGVTQVSYVEHYPPDTTACIFWLKNRQPELWRDKFDVVDHGLDRDRAARLLKVIDRRLEALEGESQKAPSDAGQLGLTH